tara:strand:+ start:93 stop:1430 length:1338 start_codon:yes stop_codon:yes gene_type:complete
MNEKIDKILLDIDNRNFTVGIIGLGYVGLPLILRFSEVGYRTTGFDIDENKIKNLNAGKSYIDHISSDLIEKAIDSNFKATNDFTYIAKMDAILVCVPTPLGVHNEPDLSFIHSTLDLAKPYFKKNQVLILESTTYPGTTEEEIIPNLESIVDTTNTKKKFTIGENFFIGYSPEREDPGNQNFSTKTIPKVVSGATKNCLKLVNAIYNQIVETTVAVSSPKVAEMTKILENIHRAVNIGLVNELKMVADRMDIDIYEVIDAASTKPFGFTPYYPGPGLGGHCIPIDPFYLTWKAKEVGMYTRFIELAGEINTSMPKYVLDRTTSALNEFGKSIKNSKLLILGLSYKKNVDDLRESPSLEIMNLLSKKGADLNFSDPFFEKLPQSRKFSLEINSIEITKNSLRLFDAVILCTDHDDFDYKLIELESSLIIDTRGKFSRNNKKVVKA